MRRTLILAAIAALLTLVPTKAEALDKETCSFQTLEAGTWTTRENEATIRCFAKELGVDPGYAVVIATRESGLNELAWNRTTDCRGLFQHLYRYWPGRVAAYSSLLERYHVKSDDVFNPRANTLVAMAMVRANGWGAWTTAW